MKATADFGVFSVVVVLIGRDDSLVYLSIRGQHDVWHALVVLWYDHCALVLLAASAHRKVLADAGPCLTQHNAVGGKTNWMLESTLVQPRLGGYTLWQPT